MASSASMPCQMVLSARTKLLTFTVLNWGTTGVQQVSNTTWAEQPLEQVAPLLWASVLKGDHLKTRNRAWEGSWRILHTFLIVCCSHAMESALTGWPMILKQTVEETETSWNLLLTSTLCDLLVMRSVIHRISRSSRWKRLESFSARMYACRVSNVEE